MVCMQQLIELFNNDSQLFWSIALSILSVVLVVVSAVVSVLMLRQNSKMIEGSTRPYIGVSSLQMNNGSPIFMIAVKNYGASAGTLLRSNVIVISQITTLGQILDPCFRESRVLRSCLVRR